MDTPMPSYDDWYGQEPESFCPMCGTGLDSRFHLIRFGAREPIIQALKAAIGFIESHKGCSDKDICDEWAKYIGAVMSPPVVSALKGDK